ncbi:glycosyltransferase [Streptomyces sp. NPDC094149]|uniref:glycosyltransferase n=1 Tax=Streptomyces sp. NPDC094149 TaxID=3155079 RepID=UPI0033193A0D
MVQCRRGRERDGMGRTVMIFAAGSRGDVQPCVALGRELIRCGNRVRIVASMRHSPLVGEAGIDFHPLVADPAEIIESAEGRELLETGRNPVSFILGMRRVLSPHIANLLEQTQAGAKGADLVLAPSFGFLGVHLGQFLRVPHAIIHFQPSQPTRKFPHPLMPAAELLGSLGNRLSFDAVDAGSWLMFRPFIKEWRRQGLGLPALSLRASMRRIRRAPVLCAFSSSIVPRPPDWGRNVHMTGFWHHEEPSWEPSRQLLDFLADGPPPVYFGFGSMTPKDPAATSELVREALRRAGLRGVLAGLPGTSEPDLLAVRETPHHWLFPRMAAIIHHGGAGTTAAALRAGKPSLVCPFFGDQFYWADRVHGLGAGPKPLPARSLTASNLTQRLRILTGTAYADAASRLGRALSSENGVSQACRVLNTYL